MINALHALTRQRLARPNSSSFKRLALASMVTLACSTAWPAPHTPTDDNLVVERVPVRRSDAERQRDQWLRPVRRATVNPNAPPASQALPPVSLAVAAAQEAIQRSRQWGDPRELGRAQAWLSPWWAMPNPPAPVRLLRATIEQSRHRFDAAQQDLDALLASEPPTSPVRAQALLTRAAIHQTRARFGDALKDCEALMALSVPQASQQGHVCALEARSHLGDASASARGLQALAQARPLDPWLALVRGELALRMGNRTLAGATLRLAAQKGDDAYAAAAWADWVLALADRRLMATTLKQLEAHDAREADAILLRRAMLLQALADAPSRAASQAATQTLVERFDAAGERGDGAETLHLRERARVALTLQGNASQAWTWAQANWQTQRESADALLYVEAAMAAGHQGEAKRFVAEREASGWRDVRWHQALAGKPPRRGAP